MQGWLHEQGDYVGGSSCFGAAGDLPETGRIFSDNLGIGRCWKSLLAGLHGTRSSIAGRPSMDRSIKSYEV